MCTVCLQICVYAQRLEHSAGCPILSLFALFLLRHGFSLSLEIGWLSSAFTGLFLLFFLLKHNLNLGSYLYGTPAISPSPKIVLNNIYNFLVFIKKGMIQTLNRTMFLLWHACCDCSQCPVIELRTY